MPNADSLIARNNGHQNPAAQQVWVVVATNGTTYNIGFDNEFVKKHLFVDPPFDVNTVAPKATRMVDMINRSRDPRTMLAAEPTPALPQLNAATLQFLKLKRLLFARKAEGTCDTCHRTAGEHAKVCTSCGHTHSAWMPGKTCGVQGCTCGDVLNFTYGKCQDDTTGCNAFVEGFYVAERRRKGLANPFAAPGGRIGGDTVVNGTRTLGGTNSVVLMSHVDVQHFKDVLVAGITGAAIAPNKRKEVNFTFGQGTAAEISATDTLATFQQRQRGNGMRVKVHHGADGVYRLQHWVAMI